MSNFSEGIWGYVKHNRSGITIKGMDFLIFAGSPDPEDDGEDIALVHHEANARLIAAAPKMYDTLILAMASLRDGGITSKLLADRIETMLDDISGENKEETGNE